MSSPPNAPPRPRASGRADLSVLQVGKSSRRRRRWWARALVVAVASVVLVGSVLVIARSASNQVRARLEDTRAALQAAADALRDGDAEAAATAFASAQDEAGRARAAMQTAPVRVGGALPWPGDAVRAAVAVTETADLIARSGSVLSQAIAQVPDGLDGLAPAGGELPTQLSQLSGPLNEAQAMLELALAMVGDAPADTPVEEVDAARAEVEARLEDALPALDSVAALSRSLPDLLGADRPKRYFLGAQNPAELRGTGGLLGAYAILTATRGAITVEPFTPTQALPQNVLGQVAVVDRAYLARYERFLDGEGSWLNVNMSPDFATAAAVLEAQYRVATGQRVDGTIFVDPFLLRSLLEATGPVATASAGTLDASGVVPYLVNQAPIALGFVEERKELLGEAAKEVLDRFFSSGVDAQARVGALADAAAGGHLLIHSADPEMQADLVEAGLAGTLVEADAGNLSVVGGNAGENKTDFYVDRTVDYEVFLDPDGTATARISVTLANSSPTAGLPDYLIGPSPDLASFLDAGDNFTMLNVYCGPCEPISTEATDDLDRGVRVERELGHNVLVTWEKVDAAETQTTTHVVDLPGAWQRRGDRGSFTPTFDNQVTINPTRLNVTVHPPAGWEVRPEREDMTAEDGVAGWSGEPGAEETFPLELMRTAPSWWERLTGLLD